MVGLKLSDLVNRVDTIFGVLICLEFLQRYVIKTFAIFYISTFHAVFLTKTTFGLNFMMLLFVVTNVFLMFGSVLRTIGITGSAQKLTNNVRNSHNLVQKWLLFICSPKFTKNMAKTHEETLDKFGVPIYNGEISVLVHYLCVLPY